MLKYESGVVVAEKPSGPLRIGLGGFFFLAFLLSWVGAAPMVLSSWGGEGAPAWINDTARALAPAQLLMTFGTIIAALLVALVNYGLKGPAGLIGALFKFRVSPFWYIVALAAPAAIFIGGAALSRRFDASLSPYVFDPAILTGVAQLFGFYLLVNTEEIAWRGYALPQLQRSMAPLKANLFLAMIWGVFHSPLFLMKGGHPAGYSIWIFAAMVLSIGLFAGWLFNSARGSVLITHLLHQSFNAWGEGVGVFPVMNDGSPWPFRASVALIVILGLFAAIMLAAKRKPDI